MLQDSLFWNYGIFIFTIITILPSSVGKGGFLHCQRYSPNRERFPDPLVLVEHRYFLCLVQSDNGQKRNLIMLCFSACCASLLVLRKLILLGSGERGCYQQQISGVKWWCAPTKYFWPKQLSILDFKRKVAPNIFKILCQLNCIQWRWCMCVGKASRWWWWWWCGPKRGQGAWYRPGAWPSLTPRLATRQKLPLSPGHETAALPPELPPTSSPKSLGKYSGGKHW